MSEEGIKSGDFVIPGDVLGVAEEFMPGEGAYEEHGDIRAAVAGTVDLDMNKRMASVTANTSVPPSPNEGDQVVCEVVDIRPQMLLVELLAMSGQEDRAIAVPSTKGRVYISQSSKKYVTNLQSEFAIGDFIRARVRDARKFPLELSTVGDDLGVIFGFCTKCRTPMRRADGKLECPECGSVETRNLAEDYGKGKI